jgi:hypothetical protein
LQYEKLIANKATFFSVATADAEVYKKLGCKNIKHIPLLLPDWKVISQPGRGTFCLYHGDLSVAENEKAATWLLQQVFTDTDIPFVIAGKNAPATLHAMAEKKNNTCIVSNPTEQEMQDMIEKAQINIIPSFNNTGIKLKLINALFNGRHCVVNEATVRGTFLESICHIAADANNFKNRIKTLFCKPFTQEDVSLRQQILNGMFDNEANAKQMADTIWNEN